MAETPWGQSQGQTTWAPGITFHHTASHGGVHLDKDRQKQLPKWAKVTNFLRTYQWWEEDADWCVPFLAFLDDIRAYAEANPDTGMTKNLDLNIDAALQTAKAYRPTVYAGYMASQSIRPQ